MKHVFMLVSCFVLTLTASMLMSLTTRAQVLKYQVKQFADVKNNAKEDTKFVDVDYRLTIDEIEKVIIVYTPSQKLNYHISKVYFDNSNVVLVCTDREGHSFISTLRRFQGSIHPMWLTMKWNDSKWNFMMDIVSEE
jgi:hypothetical protein